MRLKNIHLQIPNLLTLLNLLLGCIGIIYAFDEKYFVLTQNGGIYSTEEVANRLFTSCWLVFAAAVVDFLDGFVARALKAQSAMGKDLDSLADVVTFGVLPGMIFYQLLQRSYFAETMAMHSSKWHVIIAMLIPLAAAYRLARFNTVETSKEYFTGMPTPAVAIFAATLPLILISNAAGIGHYMINRYFLNIAVVVFSYLMISDIKMFTLKFNNFSFKENKKHYIFLAICFGAIVISPLAFGTVNAIYAAIAFCILLYIIFSLFVIRFNSPEEVL